MRLSVPPILPKVYTLRYTYGREAYPGGTGRHIPGCIPPTKVYWEAYTRVYTTVRRLSGVSLPLFYTVRRLSGASFTTFNTVRRLSGASFSRFTTVRRLSGASFLMVLTLLGGSREPLMPPWVCNSGICAS